MRKKKACGYHIAQSGKNMGAPAACDADPGHCPLTTGDGKPVPHFNTLEEAEEYAATTFPAFTNGAPQWVREENAVKRPILDGEESVGGWATMLPEATLHAWRAQQATDDKPASNPTADDILAYAREGSYAYHCALIEKAAQDVLAGHVGREAEYAGNLHQLLAYRDGLMRAGHEQEAQMIPAPGEWTRPTQPAEGEEDRPCGTIVSERDDGKVVVKTSWGIQPGMMLPTKREAYRVDVDNGDGTYTCTPYWAAPHPNHHNPDGTLTALGEASVNRRTNAPTMSRQNTVTIPNVDGANIEAGQRLRVTNARTGRISVIEIGGDTSGGPDTVASYADATEYTAKTLRNTLTGGKWKKKNGAFLPHHPDAASGDIVKIRRLDGTVSTILLNGEKNRDGTWSDYTDVTPSWKKTTSPITFQSEWRVKAPVHRSGDIITVFSKGGRAQNVILTGYDEETGTFGTARPTVEDYDSHLCDTETVNQ